MKQTYRVSTDKTVDSLEKALIAIVNSSNSGKILTIRNIYINNLSPATASPYLGLESLQRITNQTGGENLEYSKMDANNPDLPSQISIKKGAIITTTDDPFVRSVLFPQFRQDRVNCFPALSGMNIRNTAFGNIFNGGFYDTHTQGIVLREGEGLAWYVSSEGYGNYFYGLVIFKTNATGNPIYSVQFEYDAKSHGYCPFSVFNNIGSGLTITILKVEIIEAGSDTIPNFGIIPIDDVFNDGEDLTPIKMDANNSDLPSDIKIKRNATIKCYGWNMGILPSMFTEVGVSPPALLGGTTYYPYYYSIYTRGARYRQVTMYPTGKYNAPFLVSGVWADKVFPKSDIVLREGSGIAIVLQIPYTSTGVVYATYKSSFLNFEINIEFDIEDEQVPQGGGEYAYVF